jgi:CubicO group peptidase (beta-lactamase class C family)
MKILLALLMLSPVLHARADALDTTLLDYYIRQVIAFSKTAENQGVGVAVVKDNQVLFMKGYGWAERSRPVLFNEDTLFAIGSCTKAMTAFSLALAEQNGLLRLDEPVVPRLGQAINPSFELAAAVNAIDLLSHHTGLPSYGAVAWKGNYSTDEYYERIKSMDVGTFASSKFRQSFHYNNDMYAVAGKLLEAATERSWQDNIQTDVFDRLGMSAGFISTPLSELSNVAYPYLGATPMAEENVPPYAAAGAVRASLRDMSIWLRFLASRGRNAAGVQIVPLATLERQFANHNPGGVASAYAGLGWGVQNNSGFRLIRHTGGLDGYHADVSFIPELGIGVVVLVNDHGAVMNHNISALVYRYLAARYYPALTAAAEAFFGAYQAPTLTAEAQALYKSRLDFETAVSSYFMANPPPCFATYRHAGIGDFRFCYYQEQDFYVVNFGNNYWPLVPKSVDPAGNATHQISFLVAAQYVELPLFFPMAAPSDYPAMIAVLGGYRETGEAVVSVFNRVP